MNAIEILMHGRLYRLARNGREIQVTARPDIAALFAYDTVTDPCIYFQRILNFITERAGPCTTADVGASIAPFVWAHIKDLEDQR